MKGKYLYLVGIISLVGVMFFWACQESPLAPNSSEVVQEQSVRPIPLKPHAIGLAKGVISHSRRITVAGGGMLGGPQTEYNFAYIPSNTLTQDLFMFFVLNLNEDIDSENYGMLTYELSADTTTDGTGIDPDDPAFAATDHISFQEGAHSYLYLNKSWIGDFEGTPGVVNLDDDTEQFEATDVGYFWRVEVPHFSRWGWGILESN